MSEKNFSKHRMILYASAACVPPVPQYPPCGRGRGRKGEENSTDFMLWTFVGGTVRPPPLSLMPGILKAALLSEASMEIQNLTPSWFVELGVVRFSFTA